MTDDKEKDGKGGDRPDIPSMEKELGAGKNDSGGRRTFYGGKPSRPRRPGSKRRR